MRSGFPARPRVVEQTLGHVQAEVPDEERTTRRLPRIMDAPPLDRGTAKSDFVSRISLPRSK